MPQQLRQARVRVGGHLPRTLCRPTGMRTGRVLMNMPSTRSAPAPPCMRPNRTVPKTTSLSSGEPGQHLRPGQVAQAGRAHAQAARLLRAGVCASCRIDCAPGFFDAGAVALHVQQPERGGGFVDVAEHAR